MQSVLGVMSKGWLDPDNIETRVYAPEGSGARPAPVRVPIPHAQLQAPAPHEHERATHSVSNAAAEIFTRPIERRVEDRPLLTPVTLGLAALCVIAGVTIGSFIGFSGDNAEASTVAAAAAPMSKPLPRPAAAPPAPKPSRVTVAPIAAPLPPPNQLRVESSPPGATVMFVSEGAATLVGTTPIDTTIDPAHDYDVLVTLANHTSKIEHVTPGSSHHLVVALATAAR
ncbi:MAG TPA: hypothetical protein VH143_10855 [Kofleriaceae bacterium]|nr:hypothetical protein [Kofleriaceae bacterium]